MMTMMRPIDMARSFDDPGRLAVFGGVPRCLPSTYICNLKLAIYFLNLV